MRQSFGILLVMFGAICAHLASAKVTISTPLDIWKDMLATLQGDPVS